MKQPEIITFQHYRYQSAMEDSPWLCIVLHGRGGNEDSLFQFCRAMRLKTWSFLHLRAPDPWINDCGSHGFSWFPRYPEQESGMYRSKALLASCFEELFRQGHLAQNIAFLGFSQGSTLALEFLLESNFSFAGLAGISGDIHDGATLMKRTTAFGSKAPIVLTHGYQDEILPYDQVHAQAELLQNHLKNFNWKAQVKSHKLSASDLDIVSNHLMNITRGKYHA
jgi:phospholipase/carboxylesterase